MFVLAKILPTAFLKQSACTNHLLIYLLQQTKVFNWLNASQRLKAFERKTKHVPSSITLNYGVTTFYLAIYKCAFSFLMRVFILRVQCFQFAIKHFKLFKKTITSKQKKLALTSLQLNYHWLPNPKFYTDGFTSYSKFQ